MAFPTIYYPIIDDFGLVRSLSMIYKDEAYVSHKRCLEVNKAASEVLGEESDQDWTDATIDIITTEVVRRRNILGGSAPLAIGAFLLCNPRHVLLAVVILYVGAEGECLQIARQTAVRLGAFTGEPCIQQYLTIDEAKKNLHLLTGVV